jgi:hypothetical protein
VRPLLGLVPDWEAFIGEADDETFNELLRGHATTGRPLGADSFVESRERLLAGSLKRKKPGSKTHERDRYTGDLFSDGAAESSTLPRESDDGQDRDRGFERQRLSGNRAARAESRSRPGSTAGLFRDLATDATALTNFSAGQR